MRRALAGVAVLLVAAGPAAAGTPAWFPPSTCRAQTASDLVPPGREALVRAHRRPGEPVQDLRLWLDEDGRWWVTLADWQSWTQRAPEGAAVEHGDTRWVPLRASRDLVFRLDACTAELWIEPDARAVERVSLFPGAVPVTPASPGGFLNAEARYGGFLGRGKASGLLDAGAFNALVAARSAAIVDSDAVRRLDTYALHDEPGDALRLRLGDAISRPSEWEPPVRYGGIQWGRDFSLQPGRITYPLPNLRGSVAAPSTVELYANGARIGASEVGSGSYQLVGVPTLSGAGDLTVRVRDPLGRETGYSVPFYTSPRLLVPDLTEDSWEAGFLREGYAQAGDRYTRGFGAVSLRRGFSDTLTGSLRGEVTGRGGLLGFGVDAEVFGLGILSAALAGSAAGAHGGSFASLGFEHVGPSVGIAVRRRYASAGYSDLGREPGRLHFSDSARISFNTGIGGSLSAVYASERSWIAPTVRFAGAGLAQRLNRWSDLNASLLRSLGAGGGGTSLQVGVTILLAPRASANAQWAREGGQNFRRIGAQLAPPGPIGASAQAAYEDRADGLRQVDAQWAGTVGTLGAGLEGMGGHVEPALLARTGVAFLGPHAYWTRPVDGSFAVVDAAAPGVRVYRDNLEVGRTDADGRLLVPDLRAFDANRLRVDDRDLPIDRGVERSEETVAPPAGAGVALRFALDRATPVRLQLRDARGAVVPAGAELFIDGRQILLPVGRDGLVYTEIAPTARRLEAQWDGHRCVAALSHRGTAVVAGACVEVAP